MNYQDGTGQYIWLRYATQYSKDGRTHTVEMGISVPLGASAETREKLLREAETGMSQLIQRVEQHVEQALGHVQSSHTPVNRGAAPIISQPSQPSAVPQAEHAASLLVTPSAAQPTQSVPDRSTPIQARPANRSASVPAPQPTTQVPPYAQRTPAPTAQAVDVPPTRHSVGASMPSSLGPASAGGNLTIPEFLNYAKENMNLDSKQAMALLRVKSLAGINLREALENLKRIVAQNAQGRVNIPPPSPSSPSPQQPVSTVHESRPVVSTAVSSNIPSTPLPVQPSQPMALQRQDTAIDELPSGSADEALEELEQKHEANEIEAHVVQPARGFDEETDENEDLEDLDDFDNLSLSSEITPEQLSRARDKINSLRETQGATSAGAARLQVLRNAADDEVSTQQLEELVAGVWHIKSLKKLKMDQVEALISWAKQDDFLDEVEAVLIVLEEERYARGNR